MSIRTITNNQYKSVSELYRKFDAKVTGYFVISIDTDGKQTRKEPIGMYLYNKMEIFLFVMLIILLTGCGGGSGDSSIQTVGDPLIQVVETSLDSKAVQQGHVTDSLTGKPLENVEVRIGSRICYNRY